MERTTTHTPGWDITTVIPLHSTTIVKTQQWQSKLSSLKFQRKIFRLDFKLPSTWLKHTTNGTVPLQNYNINFSDLRREKVRQMSFLPVFFLSPVTLSPPFSSSSSLALQPIGAQLETSSARWLRLHARVPPPPHAAYTLLANCSSLVGSHLLAIVDASSPSQSHHPSRLCTSTLIDDLTRRGRLHVGPAVGAHLLLDVRPAPGVARRW